MICNPAAEHKAVDDDLAARRHTKCPIRTAGVPLAATRNAGIKKSYLKPFLTPLLSSSLLWLLVAFPPVSKQVTLPFWRYLLGKPVQEHHGGSHCERNMGRVNVMTGTQFHASIFF